LFINARWCSKLNESANLTSQKRIKNLSGRLSDSQNKLQSHPKGAVKAASSRRTPKRASRAKAMHDLHEDFCQGRDSNCRPMPKAFGAALFAQIVDGKLRILLRLQNSLHMSRCSRSFDLIARNDLELFA
jgi:hypothetical protein